MPAWIDRDHGVDRAGEVGERADRRRDRLRDALQPELQLGDDAERALRADEEPGQVVAGGRLARPAAGPQHLAVGGDHGQAQHVLAHGAVAHGVGAAGARRRHAAQRGVGAGVDREEQAGVAQMGVQRLARHAGLDPAVEIGGVDLEHPVEPREVDRDAALERGDVALERGAGAEGDDRRAVAGADPHQLGHLGGAGGEGHGVGRVAFVEGHVLAVLFPHRRRGRQPVADQRPRRGDRRRGIGARAGGGCGDAHGGPSAWSGP